MSSIKDFAPRIIPGIAQRKRITLTAAQIKLLNSTPITLISAPPTGKVISVDEIVGKLNFVSAQYTGSNAIEFRYTDGSGSKVTGDAASAWLDGAATAYVKTIAAAVTPVNAAVVAAIPSANPAVGDSTVTFDILYRIVTL